MRTNDFKATLKAAVRAGSIVLFGAVVTFGQQQVNLTAGPASITLPDGSTVPMWGYSCGAPVTGSTATCAKLNPAATGWSPVVITVPTGQALTINLTNNLSFTAGATTNTVPTSLVIVGQLGGGLGTTATSTPSPSHADQVTTWPIANAGPTNTPPLQGPRVQSFSTQVAAGATTPLTWSAPRPGTYLIESGTHPSIQGPMGLYGMLVVTTAPTTTAGTAYPGVTYSADVPLLLGEIDPVQNNAVQTAVNTAGFSETRVWSGQPGQCGNPNSPVGTVNTCYPPAVNYTPLYYLFNGVAFNKTSASASLFRASPGNLPIPPTGRVLVRFVNAGLRMHVPSIVGSQTGTPAVPGFSLIAEDGNPLPGVTRVQSEVFLAAGKTYDVMVNPPAAGAPALPVFDRQLSLSANATGRDAGMLAYISINGAALPSAPAFAAAVANPDTYNSVIPCSVAPCQALTVSDPSKGVIANDVNVYGVKVSTPPAKGTLTLYANGTFTYVPNAGWIQPDTFVYRANGTGPTATVTLNAATIEAAGGIVMGNITYTSTMARYLSIKRPGVLSVDKDNAGYPLRVAMSSVTPVSGLTLTMSPDGGFNASVGGPGTYTFTYKAQNSQGTLSASAALVTLIFPQPSNLQVSVVDAKTKASITDYRWILEEDRTFYVDPTKTTNTGPTGPIVPTLGVNFHTSATVLVAQGCTGTVSCENGQTVLDPVSGNHLPAVCDVGNGLCRTTASQQTPVLPSQIALNPAKRYYISVLPGDAADPFSGADIGHTMGGAPIPFACTPVPPATTCTGAFSHVTVLVQPSPLPPGKLSVLVFEDDYPLNGEQDAGGGVDVLSPNEPGLGGFNIVLMDDAGGPGDPTGQMTYDMFNMPLSNSLAGTKDPVTGLDACPISQQATTNTAQVGITSMIVTCPKYESDGITLSPLAGQAVVANLMPGRFGVVATPGADRIARGEEWLQTNTLDGQKAHDSFIRIGEPSYFQEFGPSGYHVVIGFANPKIINDRRTNDICVPGAACNNSVTGKVTTTRMSRTPDERLYSSGSRDSFAFTQCYVSLGDADGEDFAFTKCNADGTFSLSGIPDGDWRITLFDQWNDQIVDGLSTPVGLANGQTLNMGEIPVQQWQANIYTRTFIDQNGDGVSQDAEPGLALVPTNIRFRDGSFSNFNNTDLNGYAGFNEVFPLFNWYVVETDTTRYKNTGTHVVYDSGGPADGSLSCGQPGYPPCGSSTIGQFLANTIEQVSVPTNLRVPGAVYCANADCTGYSIQTPNNSAPPSTCTTSGTGAVTCTNTLSTGRIDPPWVLTQGWQGFNGQNNFLEFGKTPYVPGENGGIKGHVVYASTRPFDDPQLLLQLSWEPLVPHVTINLYQEGTAPDGSQSLKLVDTTQTSSWDDWAQGFRSDNPTIPNMNCPGQSTSDLFIYTLFNQPSYLDAYNVQYNGGAVTPLPYNSQFKCYDGMHNWNQLQPAPYDGMYQLPSNTGTGRTSAGRPTGTNCTICTANPTDGTPMLPAGKYVVEVVVPPGYELVKEEDKNILIGDNFIAPVTQQFGTLGSIFIMPDQAAVGSSYNPRNVQDPTVNLGATPRHEGDTGIKESFWPCVGQARIVPDYISLFPQSFEVAPFAGATRNLCDRKEVTLEDQASATAKFYIFTSTHLAAHFTGIITDDFTSEFDPFSPAFGEKFAPPNLPVSVKDYTGNEIARVYSDWWGLYNGLNYSTWEVNPPNPTGYGPTMMIMCMNDKGPIPGPGGTMITDPLFNPAYSQFCYELPFMPGQTQYMDTPVVPTSAFSDGYNHVDCSYPDATPAISSVTGDVAGPWVSLSGHSLTILALADQLITNYGYSGPSARTAPFNQKQINRHYGFGARCTSPISGSATCNTLSSVTIGGVAATVTGWNDTQITVTVPASVPACGMQQQAQYGGSAAKCGQLVITAGNGKQSIDTVTVTVGGKAPTMLTPPAIAGTPTIQPAIDAAQPGDLIIVGPGTYKELVLMWKPVRLQGVGGASSIIDANTHPAGQILDPWRRQVNCLFGLALNGTPISGTNPYDPGGTFTCSSAMNFAVDRLEREATVGWDATLNGNLAEQLQEPTLMGAYEGAGITVLSKGVIFPPGSNPFAADTYPANTRFLTAGDCTSGPGGANPYPSSFWCNPSRIDGLGITDASQGGGGIFVHAYGHNLEISNNRIFNNIGTLAGGISVGQGEFSPQNIQGGTQVNATGSCQTSSITNQALPYCYDMNVNLHHNSITLNSSIGDELFSATLAGAGGVSICTGADYYKFHFNWVCGNMSPGDGGGLVHLGFIYNGTIENNWILFNQSLNPTIPTNGAGIMIQGAPDTDPICSTIPDQDCAPGTSDGTGPGLVINANLIMGNAAESGSGGGIRFQGVNGTEVAAFRTRPQYWYTVQVTNNIIANNVAGWDGAGVSLQDALKVNLVNNTIVSNDSTASSGVLFNTLGAPIASAPGPPIQGQTTTGTASLPQPAGLVAIAHSAPLLATIAGAGGVLTCPTDHPNCAKVSYPVLANDVFWQNRSYVVGAGALSSQYQQNIVSLYNAAFNGAPATTLAVSQPRTDATTANGGGVIITGGTGACVSPVSYWDIGVRGDHGPNNHSSGFTLAPRYSVLTDAGDYPGLNNLGSNPTLVSQYCNGARIPPECTTADGCFGAAGFNVPPGIADAVVPNPIFSLLPVATVDEGNNWINMTWGPLALANPSVTGTDGNYGGGPPLANYALAAGSPAIDSIPTSSPTYVLAPTTDFFGNPRPDPAGGTAIDRGAVEFQGASTTPPTPTLASIAPNTGVRGTAVPVTLTGTNLTGATAVTVSGTGVTVGALTVTSTTITTTFTISATATLSARNVSVTTPGGTSNNVTFTVLGPTLASIAPNTGVRGTAVPVTLTGTNLTGATAVTVSGTGVTVGTLTVSSTTITTTFTISAAATLSARNVSVTTPIGTTNNVTFTVVNPSAAPTLTSIAPTSGARGTAVSVTLTGTNLTGATAVTVSGTGVTVGTLTVSSTTITTTFTISATATLSARNVSVTTPGGTSNNVTFTVVNPPLPTLASIAPNTFARGTTTTLVALTGTNFTATGTTVAVAPAAGITVSAVNVTSPTTITATFAIASGTTAALGAHNVTVTTPGGTSNTSPITVQGPTLASIAPNSATRPTNTPSISVPVVLTGTNLLGSTGLTGLTGGVSLAGGTFTVVNSTTINATLNISGGATIGIRNIGVATPNANGGTTNTVTFTVN